MGEAYLSHVNSKPRRSPELCIPAAKGDTQNNRTILNMQVTRSPIVYACHSSGAPFWPLINKVLWAIALHRHVGLYHDSIPSLFCVTFSGDSLPCHTPWVRPLGRRCASKPIDCPDVLEQGPSIGYEDRDDPEGDQCAIAWVWAPLQGARRLVLLLQPERAHWCALRFVGAVLKCPMHSPTHVRPSLCRSFAWRVHCTRLLDTNGILKALPRVSISAVSFLLVGAQRGRFLVDYSPPLF